MARLRESALTWSLVVLTVACDDGGSSLAPTPVTPGTPATEAISITVLEDGSDRGIPDAIVTCLSGCDGRQTKVTDGQGVVTLTGHYPLLIRAEKSGYITVAEKSVTDATEATIRLTPVPPEQILITVNLPYPGDANFNPGVSGATVICLGSCDGRQTKVTDGQGVVTLTGHLPLMIRVEKPGYITLERQVTTGNMTVVIGHEWPSYVGEIIRRLGLTEIVDSGELLLIWADTRYFTGPSRGGHFGCHGGANPVIMVREWRGMDFMLNTLIHELAHAWQGQESTNPPCDIIGGWPPSLSGQAWIEAIRKDLDPETGPGPIPGFDDDIYDEKTGKTLSEIPHENQAALLADWYMGTTWGRNPGSVTKADFYKKAPHRSRELEGNVGPPR